MFHSTVKNASAALPGSVTSEDFDLSPGTISALPGRLARQVTFVKKLKKKIRKFNPRKYKIATLYCKKNYQNI